VIPVWAAIAVPSLAGLFLVVAHANSIGQQNALVGLRFAGEIKLHPTRRRVTRITDTRSSAVDHCLRSHWKWRSATRTSRQRGL
jgi:hypothetical protein